MTQKFIKTYVFFVIFFVLGKLGFLFYNISQYPKLDLTNLLPIIWHGIPLDISVAAYLSIIPIVFFIARTWCKSKVIFFIEIIYTALISFLVSTIMVSDTVLYKFWGFKLDTTPIFYFTSSPKDALASESWLFSITTLISILLITTFLFKIIYKLSIKRNSDNQKRKIRTTIELILLLGLLFIPIRGGLSVATLNTGKVYFSSTNMKLNHAAINPCFSLLESACKNNNFNEQYRFMKDRKATKIFAKLNNKNPKAPTKKIFKTERPNIVYVVLEGFMAQAVKSLGGFDSVAINLDRYAKRNVSFKHYYANSFRTDRGLVATLSGYPSQPTNSIMKHTKKAQNLPSVPKRLKDIGYNLKYYYGGDVNFTHMKSYLISMGFEDIVCDASFKSSELTGRWGALDHLVFNKCLDDLQKGEIKEPFLKVVQTSSSHEPFEVPFSRLKDKQLNSIAYTDSCLGDFLDKFRETKYWKNSIIVLVPDHSMLYPLTARNLCFKRYMNPLVFTGGAAADSTEINTIASQMDIAATILSQMKLSHKEFLFSKDILNPDVPHFGYFSFPDAFGIIDSKNQVIFNCKSKKVLEKKGLKSDICLDRGKALVQKLYDNMSSL